ncbi:MAG: hypothetical protein N3A01_03745 [Bacteroidales bacterium]|nr:hypothetical protein [Bacteroidales bacterium]
MLDFHKDYNLIYEVSSVHAPSGNAEKIINYIQKHVNNSLHKYRVGDSLVIRKGNPSFVFFIHVDTVGFISQHENILLNIGHINVDEQPFQIVSENNENYYALMYGPKYKISFSQTFIEPGVFFTYKQKTHIKDDLLYSTYIDNRICLFLALKALENVENILLAFSTDEEICGGTTIKLSKFIFEEFKIRKAIICDATIATPRVKLSNGIALTYKDEAIPSINFVRKIEHFLKMNNVKLQREIEDFGQSDGALIAKCPYPIEWAFIGIPVQNNHSPLEVASLYDITEMYNAIYLLALNNLNI